MNEQFTFLECVSDQNKIIRGSVHNVSFSKTWFIFCHGFTGQRLGPHYLFVKISRALSEAGYSSVRFDFCGSGESDGQFYDMNIHSMTKDLHSIYNKIKGEFHPEKIVVLGHSFGGLIAVLCTEQLSIDGLVLLSPVANPSGLIQSHANLLNRGPNADGHFENGPHEMNISFLDDLRSCGPQKILTSHFHGPLLVIQGNKDPSVSVEESKLYIDTSRDAGIQHEYHLLEGADHNYSRVSDVKMLCSTITSWSRERF